ncbi:MULTISPECIES: hypothetical protein [Nonomuraea]|uniref:Uncharacterized protein n=1 Tax=Nonomuraea mangrovi TaxID=2316207 RepID=A0ABW4T964_9ACTN
MTGIQRDTGAFVTTRVPTPKLEDCVLSIADHFAEAFHAEHREHMLAIRDLARETNADVLTWARTMRACRV